MRNCRISNKPTRSILNFGRQPLGNGFLKENETNSEYFYKMSLEYSEKSMMVQLLDQPSPDRMFHENYAFFSGTSEYMSEHFKGFANSVIQSPYLSSKPFVIELGCNDGIMLQHFYKSGIRHLGIEPSHNVAIVAAERGLNVKTQFFSSQLASSILNEYGQVDAILAANVMCHIPDIRDIAKAIKILLKPTGVLQFEDPYLGDIIKKTSYDQIYDEHVFLFSAHSIKHLFGLEDLELVDVIPQSTHGGSMRYVLARKGAYPVKESVFKLLKEEKMLGLNSFEKLLNFASNVEQSKLDLINLLKSLKSKGKTIAGYGATSKSTTILNYCKIGPDLIDYITDTTPLKQGKLTPGMHIPVVSHEHFLTNPPDYSFLFAWNHAEEIMSKEVQYTRSGGKWIVHVPEVKILS